jgi:hypothetical protein
LIIENLRYTGAIRSGCIAKSSKGGRFMAKKEYSFELKSNLAELDNLCQNLEDFGKKSRAVQKNDF